MRVAICMSGHVRTLLSNIDSIKKNIINANEQVDFFLHTWTTSGWRTEGSDITKTGFKGFDLNSEEIQIEEILNLLNPKKFIVENYLEKEDSILERASLFRKRKKYDIDRPENLVSMSYKVFECNKLKKEYELDNNFIYDVVVRTRPDFHYYEPIDFSKFDLSEINLLNKYLGDGVSDLFAFSNSSNMDVYAEAFNLLEVVCNKDTVPIGNGIYVVQDSNTSTFNPHEFYHRFLQLYLPNFRLHALNIDLLRTEKDSQRFNC